MGNKVGESVGFAEDLDGFSAKDAVLHKMKAKKEYYQKKFKKNFEEVAELLSNKEKLLGSYLSPEWYVTKDLNNRFVKEFNKQTKEENEGELEDGDINEPFTPIGGDDDKPPTAFQKQEEENLKTGKVKIKFVISELRSLKEDVIKRNLYFNLYTPVLQTMRTLPEFGFYHLGLQIGPFMIEMVDSGICTPRKLSSRSAILSQDLSVYETEREIKGVLDIVAEVIIKWNTTFSYVSTGGDPKKKNTGNCQQFCFDILENLGISLPMDNNYPLKTYIQKLITNDSAGLDLYMDPQFMKKFNQEKKKITFKSHKELDQFVRNCQKIDIQFNLRHTEYWNILKGFDRSVWLKHFTDPKIEEFKPLMKKSVVDDDDDDDDDDDELDEVEIIQDCPFGDPTKSQS